MKIVFQLLLLIVVSVLVVQCTKVEQENVKPKLMISIRDDSGKAISGIPVKLYKNAGDPGLMLTSDAKGIVLFTDLEPVQYYWLAQQGCKTNKSSQTTTGAPLITNAVLYGYSVLAETGNLRISTNSSDRYTVTDSATFTATVVRDTPYISFPRIKTYRIYSKRIATPTITKDTTIFIRCNDTARIQLP